MPILWGYPFNYTLPLITTTYADWLSTWSCIIRENAAVMTLEWRQPSADPQFKTHCIRFTSILLLATRRSQTLSWVILCFKPHLCHTKCNDLCLNHWLHTDFGFCPCTVSLISKQHKLFILSNLNTYSDLGALLASNEGHKEPLWVQTPPVDRWDLCHQEWELGCF